MIENVDFTSIAIALMAIFGGIYGVKVYVSHKDSSSKALKGRIKTMEENEDFFKKQIRIYKNKASNMERGPQIEGDVENVSDLLPTIIGEFSDYAPKWLKPFLKDAESQKMIMKYIEDNPEAAKQWLGKIVGKGKGNKEESEVDSIGL